MSKTFILLSAVLAAAIASVAAPAATTRHACSTRVYAFGGGVVSLGPNSLTVEIDRTGNHDRRLDGRRLAYVRVNAETKITRDGKQIQLSDLVLNEHVAIVAEGCRNLDGMRFTARTIRAGDRDVSFAGSVVSLGQGSLTVEVDRTGIRDAYLAGRRIDVAVDQNTKIMRDGKPIQLSDLVLGEHVAVQADAVAHRFTATLIRADDRELAFAGSVTTIGSASLGVEASGKTISLAVDQNTKIMRDGKAIQLSDLLVGEHVTVTAVAIANQYTAETIRGADHDIAVAGSIVAVGSSSLTVEVDRTGRNDGGLGGTRLTVAVDANTQITLNGQPAQLSQLAAGDRVTLTAVGITNHYTAKQIHARLPKPKPTTTTTSSTTTTQKP